MRYLVTKIEWEKQNAKLPTSRFVDADAADEVVDLLVREFRVGILSAESLPVAAVQATRLVRRAS